MKLDFFKYSSPLGDIYCAYEGNFLVDVSIGGEGATSSLSPAALSFFQELDAYFRGELKVFRQDFKFMKGTTFEKKVWLALREAPYGETRSYKWIAERAGTPDAARAAGQALKKNPLPLILPCHRIIASDGSLGGFSCGVEIKKWLLSRERAHGKRGILIQ